VFFLIKRKAKNDAASRVFCSSVGLIGPCHLRLAAAEATCD